VKHRLQSRSRPPKMLVRQSRLDLRMVLVHELRKHVAVLQPLTVLREAGRVSDRIVRRQPHEPAVQAIVVQLLHQPSFRQNAVERACTAIAPEDRGASFVRIELTKLRFSSPSTSQTSARILLSRWFGGTNVSPRCTKTAGPDPQMCPAYEPPPIRDKKVNQQILATARGISADC
jgi:hypothetical protein